MSLNIKKASLQRIFEFALKHVRKQGKPGMDTTPAGNIVCAYQTEDDLKCVVGAMLTPEQLAEAVRLKIGVVGEHREFFDPIVGADRTGKKMRLMKALQMAHDNAATDTRHERAMFLTSFEGYMQDVAAEFGLHYEPPGGKTLRS